MKLISLNLWAGRGGRENLLAFFKKYKDVDIFCLQEMWEGGDHRIAYYQKVWTRPDLKIVNTLISDISKVLIDHAVFFYPFYEDFFGQGIFIKKKIRITQEGEIFVHKTKENSYSLEDENHARNVQYMTIETKQGLRTVVNFHGLWNGKGKTDSVERLIQSDNIVQFIKDIKNPFVLCGDFNLLPNTKSLKRIEEAGLKNLITEFGITNTRSSFYKKEERFADYTLVSPGITVNDFKVLPDEVSDHLAMYLDFK